MLGGEIEIAYAQTFLPTLKGRFQNEEKYLISFVRDWPQLQTQNLLARRGAGLIEQVS